MSQLRGEFLPRINIGLPSLRLLDLDWCEFIELEMLEVTKLPSVYNFLQCCDEFPHHVQELAGQKDDLVIKGYNGNQVRAAELERRFQTQL